MCGRGYKPASCEKFQRTIQSTSPQFFWELDKSGETKVNYSFAPHSEFSACSPFEERFKAFPVSAGMSPENDNSWKESRVILPTLSKKERSHGSPNIPAETGERITIWLSSPFSRLASEIRMFQNSLNPRYQSRIGLNLAKKIPKFVQMCGLWIHIFQLFSFFGPRKAFLVKFFFCSFYFLPSSINRYRVYSFFQNHKFDRLIPILYKLG